MTWTYLESLGSLAGSPDSSVGKECACNAGDLVQFLGWEDPLEKGKVTHSSIWLGKFHGQSMGSQSRTRLSDFHSLGLFGGSVTQLAPFPSLGCEKSAMDGRHSGEHGPWKHEEAGLHHAFSHLLPALQPHFRCTSSGFLRSPKSDQSSISSPPLLCRNVTVFISLLTSLHFFSASGTVLGLGRIRWEDLVQALRKVVVWEEVFSGPICFPALLHSLAVWGLPWLGGQDVTFPP